MKVVCLINYSKIHQLEFLIVDDVSQFCSIWTLSHTLGVGGDNPVDKLAGLYVSADLRARYVSAFSIQLCLRIGEKKEGIWNLLPLRKIPLAVGLLELRLEFRDDLASRAAWCASGFHPRRPRLQETRVPHPWPERRNPRVVSIIATSRETFGTRFGWLVLGFIPFDDQDPKRRKEVGTSEYPSRSVWT